MALKQKEQEKDEKHVGKLFQKKPKNKVSSSFRLKSIQIIVLKQLGQVEYAIICISGLTFFLEKRCYEDHNKLTFPLWDVVVRPPLCLKCVAKPFFQNISCDSSFCLEFKADYKKDQKQGLKIQRKEVTGSDIFDKQYVCVYI